MSQIAAAQLKETLDTFSKEVMYRRGGTSPIHEIKKRLDELEKEYKRIIQYNNIDLAYDGTISANTGNKIIYHSNIGWKPWGYSGPMFLAAISGAKKALDDYVTALNSTLDVLNDIYNAAGVINENINKINDALAEKPTSGEYWMAHAYAEKAERERREAEDRKKKKAVDIFNQHLESLGITPTLKSTKDSEEEYSDEYLYWLEQQQKLEEQGKTEPSTENWQVAWEKEKARQKQEAAKKSEEDKRKAFEEIDKAIKEDPTIILDDNLKDQIKKQAQEDAEKRLSENSTTPSGMGNDPRYRSTEPTTEYWQVHSERQRAKEVQENAKKLQEEVRKKKEIENSTIPSGMGNDPRYRAPTTEAPTVPPIGDDTPPTQVPIKVEKPTEAPTVPAIPVTQPVVTTPSTSAPITVPPTSGLPSSQPPISGVTPPTGAPTVPPTVAPTVPPTVPTTNAPITTVPPISGLPSSQPPISGVTPPTGAPVQPVGNVVSNPDSEYVPIPNTKVSGPTGSIPEPITKGPIPIGKVATSGNNTISPKLMGMIGASLVGLGAGVAMKAKKDKEEDKKETNK